MCEYSQLSANKNDYIIYKTLKHPPFVTHSSIIVYYNSIFYINKESQNIPFFVSQIVMTLYKIENVSMPI